jgi:hypothetical protein
MENNVTDNYRLYIAGQDYNTRIDYYAKTNLHWRFYNNDHWHGIVTNGLPTATFPIARSAINYFIASIMSQKIKAQYTVENIPDEPTDPIEIGKKQFAELMSGYADVKWEKDKMDSKLRQLLLDGANSGDFCAYGYFDPNKETGQDEKGDFVTELVDGVNVIFGNPNNPDVESQPWIEIIGRELVSKLREEAKANGIPKQEYMGITSDEDNEYQAGQYGRIEMDTEKDKTGKALYIIKFWKENGKVYWNKTTKTCDIRKKVELGISRYPIAWGNWDKVKNSYHGMAVMAGMIPNNILINQLFAMVAYWMRLSAFGKVVFDSNRISSWSNKIGEAIKVDGDVSNVVYQLQAGNFNTAVMQVIELAIKYTKDFIGASDAALGQVKPENTSAIIAVAKQAAIPLENIQANLYQFVEDLMLIWGEFMLKKYNNRVVSYREKGKMMTAQFSPEMYRDIMLNVKVDVGPSTYWSEITSMQTLDNLLNSKQIDLMTYLERIPDGIIPKKQELIEKLQEQIQQAQMMEQKQAQYEQMAQFVESLPPEQQAQLEMMRQSDPEGYEQTVMQMMGGGQGAMPPMQQQPNGVQQQI